MKNALLIIGEDIGVNAPFLDYIFCAYKRHFGELGEFRFVSRSDKELPFIIEHLCARSDSLCIYASSQNCSVAAKILATLSGDILELKSPQTLAPSRAEKFSDDGFLIKLNQTYVNLLKADANQKLPAIDIKTQRDFGYFHLVDIDEESAKILLEPLAKTYEVQIYSSQILSNLALIRVEANKFGQTSGFINGAKNLFSGKFFEGEDVFRHVASTLIASGLKLTFAESCTAGLAAAKFGAFAGVSAAFNGSLVTYANEMKRDWLGVSDEILQTYGAVSEQCVMAMLKGALKASESDFSLAISGIAGPDGGSEAKPVGTVFVGAYAKDGERIIERLNLNGDRNYIREQSALAAYVCLLKLKPSLFLA